MLQEDQLTLVDVREAGGGLVQSAEQGEQPQLLVEDMNSLLHHFIQFSRVPSFNAVFFYIFYMSFI